MHLRDELKRTDRRLTQERQRTEKNPTAAANRMQEAEEKVNSASAVANATEAQVSETFSAIEVFKVEVLFPQIVRIFPS